MTIGVVGRKAGMTRIFTEEGVSIPVTVMRSSRIASPSLKPKNPMAIAQCKSLSVSVVLRVSQQLKLPLRQGERRVRSYRYGVPS